MTSRYEPAEIDTGAQNNTHASLVRLTGRDRRVLELGAATGYMTRVLQQRGCRVTAVEFDPAAFERLERVADRAVLGDLNDPSVLDTVGGPFDAVLAGDVLEHLIDPATVLTTAVSLLAQEGHAVISLPNIAHVDVALSLLQGRFEYRPKGLLDATHLRFFTYESMLSLVESTGLLITEIDRIIVPPFRTELGLDRGSVEQAVLAAALSVPDAETYQFVIKAVRDTGDESLHQASRDALERGLHEDRLRRGVLDPGPVPNQLEEQVATISGHLEEAARDRDVERARVAERDRRIFDLHTEVDALRRELTTACIGESQRARLDARVNELEAEVTRARAAAGVVDSVVPVDQVVESLRARVADLEDSLERLRGRTAPAPRLRRLVRKLRPARRD